MNGLQNVRHSRLTTIRCAALLFLECVTLGALAGGAFGLLCGGLHDLLHWKIGNTFTWGMGFASAGAATGMILGLYAMTDRVLNAKYWEGRSTHPRERDRAHTLPTTAPKSRVVEFDGHAEVPSDRSPARIRPAQTVTGGRLTPPGGASPWGLCGTLQTRIVDSLPMCW